MTIKQLPGTGVYQGLLTEAARGTKFSWDGRVWLVCGIRRGSRKDGVLSGAGVWACPMDDGGMVFFPVEAKEVANRTGRKRKDGADTSHFGIGANGATANDEEETGFMARPPRRNDAPVSNYKTIDEGQYRAVVTKAELGPHKFRKGEQTLTLTWSLTEGTFAGETTRQFLDFDTNELNDRSAYWVFGNLLGIWISDDMDDDEFPDHMELMGQQGIITIAHSKPKQVTGQDGVERTKIYANVVDVQPAPKRKRQVVSEAAAPARERIRQGQKIMSPAAAGAGDDDEDTSEYYEDDSDA